jgi:hypothetical protein
MTIKLKKEWARLKRDYPAIEKKQSPFEKFVKQQGYDTFYFINGIKKRGKKDD